ADERREQTRLDAMLNFERVLWRSGVQHIAGVDEVGVGPLAGPVIAAAVIFREATCVGIGAASVEEIDEINVYRAGLLAMRRAVEALAVAPQHVLVDARTIPGVNAPQNPFTKGDGINFSIAAASIVAKTPRDALMEELDRAYPEYGFRQHKGYSTPEHQTAIRRFGPCPLHRMSYPFIKELRGQYSAQFYQLKERLARAPSRRTLQAVERRLELD